ncbi:MAG: CotH kinase family protein, partial [Verrucomicrobiales bacterium]|nr:CotH kinase family protein [Verrucomicrobiales bacterium]
TYELPGFRDWLVAGTNVLAVQAMNTSLGGSSDFVFMLEMEAEVDETAPRVASTSPPNGARIRELTQWTVVFDEPVTGVEAADLRVNGIPATQVSAFGPDQYVFEFPAAPSGAVTVTWDAAAGIRDLSARGNVFAGGTWNYTVDPSAPPPGVTLTEFMADNEDTLNDEDGDASDWIEIGNSSDQPVNLAGWGLTDDPALPFAWRFPVVSVPARGFLVVFASGKNRTNATGRLHTHFRLNRNTGYLGLFRPGGGLASSFEGYPAQQEDVSYGRLTTDPLQTGYFPVPTPGAVNAEGGAGFAPEVSFSRIGGTFLEPFALSLSTEGTAATVRYTLDGTVPTESSAVFGNPLSITNSTRVRARAFVSGLLPGPLGAEYYIALNPSVAGVTSSLPLVVIHSFGRGAVPANGEYPAVLTVHEPRGGTSSLAQAPDLRTRVRLNRRGSSTFGNPKANYSVEFRDERDAARDLEVLGMPAESDWILYAPNNFEPILIHNPMAFQISREMGRYAPRTRFVEVYVMTASGALSTSQYAGVYVLMEKVKRDANRVDIPNLEPEHLREPEISGGYLLKIDRLDPGDGGLFAGFQSMGFVDPKEEEFALPQRAPQREYIQNYLDRFAESLYSADWQDPVRGWRAYVDVPSWVDHHLINVLTFNVDALRLSTYFYKPRQGKLEFGPVWDFDRALNSTDGRDSNPVRWRSAVSDLGTDFFNYPWWGRLFEDPDFWQAWIDRYQELRTTTLSTNRLFGMVDELTGEVRSAQPRDAARWPGFITPRGSYANEIAILKTWLGRRLNFMDTNFLARPSLDPAAGMAGAGFTVRLSGPPGATLYYTTDGSDPRASGGGIAATAKVYGSPIPMTAATVVRARARNTNHRNLTGENNPPISSPWSGVVESRYGSLEGPGLSDLALTEIHFRPAPPTAAELAALPGVTRSDFEFIEVWNRGSRAVDLWPVRFGAGVEFRFATGAVSVLEADARLVVVRNAAAFRLRHGTAATIAGVYADGLSASGERLRLVDQSGRVLADVAYADGWHPAADGLGFTLVPVDESQVGNPWLRRSDWRPSTLPGGSPGAPDPVAPAVPEVVISEALTHTDPPQVDGVELRNLGQLPADIGGWYLTDDRSVPAKYQIPAGTVLAPGGSWWVDETKLSPDPLAPRSFLLDSLGDSIWLFAATPEGALLGSAHGFNFGAAANGVSFGREVSCDGAEVFLPQIAVTPGGDNAGRSVPPVVLSEIHYHPPDLILGTSAVNDTRFEFVEIVNRSGAPVPFFDPANPTNTWRLRDAVTFRFPTNEVLPAGAAWVVANFNPENNPGTVAAFRAAFAVPAETRLFGPFEGSLSNDDARLLLARPDVPEPVASPRPGFVPYITVDSVHYSDRAPWPIGADGEGGSLQRVEWDSIGDRAGAWIAAAPTPGVVPSATSDADADGLPDGWEIGACLNPNLAADAQQDRDGDGATARQEFVMNTDPNDAGSVLRWTAAQGVEGSTVVLRFQAEPGVEYVVEKRGAAADSPWVRVGVYPAGTQNRAIEVKEPAEGDAQWYRIRVGNE